MSNIISKWTVILGIILQIGLQAAITPIPIPPGTVLTGNPLIVNDYIDSLTILPGSDLSHVIFQLPLTSSEFIEALDKMHPALLQDITFATDENMQSVRQTMTGRNAYLRHGRCLKHKGLFSDHCNLGPSQLWVTPIGVFNDQATIEGLHTYRSTSPGIVIGFDSQPNKYTTLGFALGYTYTDLHWKDGYGNSNWQAGYFGVYGTAIDEYFYLDAAVLGSYEFYKTKRVIKFSKFDDLFNDFYKPNRHDCDTDEPFVPSDDFRRGHHHLEKCGVSRRARNRFKGYAILSHIGLGFRMDFNGLQLIPFGSIDYDFVDQDGHREYFGRSLNLRVKANHAHLLRGEVGLTATGCIPYNCTWFRPSATVSYIRKTVLQGNRFTANFVNYGDGDPKFTVFGTKRAIDLVAPGFGLEVLFSNQYIISFTYDAELSRKHITQRAAMRFQRNY